jgi:hypothetical protein
MNQKLKIAVSGILLYSLSCNSIIYSADESFVKRSTDYVTTKFATLASTITQNKTVAVATGAAATIAVGAVTLAVVMVNGKNKENALEKKRLEEAEAKKKNNAFSLKK